MSFRIPFVFILLAATRLSAAQPPATGGAEAHRFSGAGLPVVLKMDDMVDQGGEAHPRWRRFAEFAAGRRLKAGIGIITRSLEGGKPAYFDWLKRLQATGLVEFWNHGYDHRRWKDEGGVQRWEFSGTDEAHQRWHLRRGQELAREKLGVELRSFGAPFNATDATTAQLLSEEPGMSVWLYGDAARAPASVFVARRTPGLALEPAGLRPDAAAFERAFEQKADALPYLVLQGHPPQWDDAAFAEFMRVVDFLEARGARFVLPLELREIMAAREKETVPHP